MKIIVLTAVSIFLSACGNSQVSSPDDASMGDVESELTDNTAKSSASMGQTSTEETRSAVTSPTIAYGVSHYPNGRRVGVSQDFLLKEGRNPMWYQYETSDEPAQVLAFYKGEAEKAGFDIKSEKTREIWREISLKSVRPGGGVMNVTTLGEQGSELLVNVHISEDS